MLLNTSYTNSEIKKKIETQAGTPLPLQERIKLKGIDSPKLFITSSSIEIHNILILDSKPSKCTIEIRSKGVLVRFQSQLNSFVLAIPYYKLKVYKGKAEEYSLHKDHYFIKLSATHKSTHRFFQKLINFKIENTPTHIGDL